jgi:non-ribosomal peptide synthetase component F
LKVERSVEHTPLFQVKFVYQNAPMSLLELPNLRVQVLGNESGATRVHLQLTLWESLASLKGWFEYNAQIFNATRIARLSSDFFIILDKIVGQPDIRLSELDQVLTDANRERQSARVQETREVRSQKYRTIRRKAVSLT